MNPFKKVGSVKRICLSKQSHFGVQEPRQIPKAESESEPEDIEIDQTSKDEIENEPPTAASQPVQKPVTKTVKKNQVCLKIEVRFGPVLINRNCLVMNH